MPAPALCPPLCQPPLARLARARMPRRGRGVPQGPSPQVPPSEVASPRPPGGPSGSHGWGGGTRHGNLPGNGRHLPGKCRIYLVNVAVPWLPGPTVPRRLLPACCTCAALTSRPSRVQVSAGAPFEEGDAPGRHPSRRARARHTSRQCHSSHERDTKRPRTIVQLGEHVHGPRKIRTYWSRMPGRISR